jgi:hypothetical protein
LPFCHVTLKGQKPRPPCYPADPKTVGDHLLRKRSRATLASILRVDPSTVRQWEAGPRKPLKRSKAALAAWCGINIAAR